MNFELPLADGGRILAYGAGICLFDHTGRRDAGNGKAACRMTTTRLADLTQVAVGLLRDMSAGRVMRVDGRGDRWWIVDRGGNSEAMPVNPRTVRALELRGLVRVVVPGKPYMGAILDVLLMVPSADGEGVLDAAAAGDRGEL